MNTTDEIRELFAVSTPGNAYRLESVDKSWPAFVVRLENETFGVAVYYDGREVNEEFASARLHSGNYILDGRARKCLMLTSSAEKSRNEFADFCSIFVRPESRKSLILDPVAWWEHWKELIGNNNKDKKPYAVLGEMMMYDYLLERGEHAEWKGPSSSSHDLVSDQAEYEVKSTLSRYKSIIHVAGQFQLQSAEKRLLLYFCRFEEDVNGRSINDYVEKLVSLGVPREDIDQNLRKDGYERGKSARDKKYMIHEVVEYDVDDHFPRITTDSLKNGVLPEGIEQLSYDVDLSMVKGHAVRLSSTDHNTES